MWCNKGQRGPLNNFGGPGFLETLFMYLGPKQYVTDYFLHRHKIPYETMKLFTTPIAEIIWVKNVRAIFVCGFLMK